MYQGFFRYGGIEFANAQRATLQSRAFDCPITWLLDDGCENLYRAVNGGIQYDAQTVQQAPWYDENVPESGRFLGVYPVSVDGLDGSTRTGNVVEGILDGGDVTGLRKASRRVRMRLELVAAGDDALDYGMAWLSSVLDPDRCGVHGTRCGVADLQWLSTCPPDSELVLDTTPSYWEEQATNLALNGGFEYGSSTVEVYRNRFPYAGMATITGWSMWPGTGSPERIGDVVASGGVDGGRFLRQTWSVPPTGGGGYASQILDVPAGTVNVISAYVRSNREVRVAINYQWYDASNNPTSSGTNPQVIVPANTWTKVESTELTVPAGSAKVQWRWYLQGNNQIQDAGDTFDFDHALWEQGALRIGEYFDGAGPSPDPDLTPSWVGGADVSESVLTGVMPVGTGGTGSSSVAVRSTRWKRSGSHSVRIIPTMVGSYLDAAYFSGADVRGKTLTVSATSWAEEALPTESRRRRFGLRLVGYSTPLLYSEPSENVPGEERMTATFNIPDDPSITQVLVRLFNSGKAGDPDVWWDDLVITEGDSVVPFFDGDTADTPDGQRYEWTGAPGNSTSTWESFYEQGYTPWEIAATNIANQPYPIEGSIGWSSNNGTQYPTFFDPSVSHTPGIPSQRVERTASNPNHAIASMHSLGSFGNSLAGRIPAFEGATLSASLWVMSDQPDYESTLRIQWIDRNGGVITTSGTAFSVGVANQWSRVTASDTAPEGTDSLRLILAVNKVSGMVVGGEQVWATEATVVRGGVEDLPEWFSGATPDNPTERYRWLGTPNESASVREVRSEIKREETNEEYAQRIRGLTRVLHDVAAISGPTVVERHARPAQGAHGAYGNLVEVVFASETPFIYSLPRQLDIGAVSTQVVQDIPYNLAKYPSAEIASTSDVLVATNYSTNPSVEANITGWARQATAPITTAMVSAAARSADIAAAGSYSAKTTFTPSGSGTGGTFMLEQSVALGGGAGARYSINVWAAALGAGRAKVASLQLVAIWRAGASILRTDSLGTFDADGQVISARSVEPPATADNVLLRVVANMGSWTTGDIVNLYADALSVSVP